MRDLSEGNWESKFNTVVGVGLECELNGNGASLDKEILRQAALGDGDLQCQKLSRLGESVNSPGTLYYSRANKINSLHILVLRSTISFT